jgi:hypothetical protein
LTTAWHAFPTAAQREAGIAPCGLLVSDNGSSTQPASPRRGPVGSQVPFQSPGPETQGDGDEPEAVLLLIACGIGLLTGSGVVLFNVAIHAIQAIGKTDCRA